MDPGLGEPLRMVSPMREKRAWPPREKDADAEAVAAFEQTVAVVKETVVRSGEVLVSAKEDLNDHQRWLKVQTAQVAGRPGTPRPLAATPAGTARGA